MPADEGSGIGPVERIFKEQPTFRVDFDKLSSVSVEMPEDDSSSLININPMENVDSVAVSCEVKDTNASTSADDTQYHNEGTETYCLCYWVSIMYFCLFVVLSDLVCFY